MGPQIFSQLFMNPAFVTIGSLLAIVSTPIIIHFINRLRYKRVRFAAMEFLLNSEKQNRQRVLLEQLLLLLLRILLVLALLALIARMVSSQASVIFGSKDHHLVLLDDSASMRQKWGETSAFQEGIKSIKALVAKGAQQPGRQKFTLLLLSNPSKPIFSDEDVNNDLIKKLETKLNNLKCSHRSLDLVEGLKTVKQTLDSSKGASKTLHLISDFRKEDWEKRSAIADGITELSESKVTVNLSRSLPEDEMEIGNLAITSLTGNVQAAAPGIPVTFQTEVYNYSKATAENVRMAVFMDGQKLPMTLRIAKIEPEQSVKKAFVLTYQLSGKHKLELALESDALDIDNHRYMTLDIKSKNEVLVINGAKKGKFDDEGFYVADALEPRPNLGITGYAPLVEKPDYLGKHPLAQFQAIYMLNVPELNTESFDALTEFVKNGGGLVWFMGQRVNPEAYNSQLYVKGGTGLFPVPLRDKNRDVSENKETKTGPDLKVSSHPIFEVFNLDPVHASTLSISHYHPVADDWERDDNVRKDGVATIAHFRNNAPLMFEHQFGEGKIITCLTSGGSEWSNWPLLPCYLPFILEIQKHIGKDDSALFSRISGSTIALSLDPVEYSEKIEITAPGVTKERPRSYRVDAKYVKVKPPEKKENEETNPLKVSEAKPKMRLEFNFGSQETDRPGIYVVKLAKTAGDDAFDEQWLAFNPPASESQLPVALDEEIEKRIDDKTKFSIFAHGDSKWMKGEDAGQEMRRFLLIIIVLIFLAEQALAYRLSFHSSGSSKQKVKLAGPARAAVS